MKLPFLHRDDRGQDLVEYALIAAIISVGAVSALNVLATAVTTSLNNVLMTFVFAIW
jgi:Flp pilus assembly pilin Flp